MKVFRVQFRIANLECLYMTTQQENLRPKIQHKEDTFLNCHCPGCEFPLKDTVVSTTHCPLCNQKLDPAAVWLTRKYDGVIELPFWVRAFGWPFFMMIFGILFFVIPYFYYNYFDVKIPSLIFAVGFIYFVVK